MGGGGYFTGQKMEIPGRGGAYVKFPPWWGYGYFLELHIYNLHLPLGPSGSLVFELTESSYWRWFMVKK